MIHHHHHLAHSTAGPMTRILSALHLVTLFIDIVSSGFYFFMCVCPRSSAQLPYAFGQREKKPSVAAPSTAEVPEHQMKCRTTNKTEIHIPHILGCNSPGARWINKQRKPQNCARMQRQWLGMGTTTTTTTHVDDGKKTKIHCIGSKNQHQKRLKGIK